MKTPNLLWLAYFVGSVLPGYAGFAADRLLWQIGTYAPATTARNSEFPGQNNKNDPPPGYVTRVPGDPAFVPDAVTPLDDDHYTAGFYPAGFNQLAGPISVMFDEPWSAWESSLTAGDRTNRLHFVLSPDQVAPGSRLRMEVRYPAAFHFIGDVRQGFGLHDIVTRFRNGSGAAVVLDSRTVTEPTTVVMDVDPADIGATAGPNTFELVRTGPPSLTGHSHSIGIAYVRIESQPVSANTPPQLSPVPPQLATALHPFELQLGGSDAETAPESLVHALLSGPAGLTVTPGGLLTWTPPEAPFAITYPVSTRVTDDGEPPLSATNSFSIVVPGLATADRLLWQIGTYAPTTTSRNSEFSPQSKGNPAPGLVTRVPGDPEHQPGANPSQDDDYYTAGHYPVGFNGLDAPLSVYFDEPWSAWEGSLSAGDRTNRLHFVLSPEQVAAGSRIRLEVRYPAAFHNIGDVRQGFGFHDIVTRFRNGVGVETVLDARTVSEPLTVSMEIETSTIGATAGPNTVEFVRTSPLVTGHSYSIGFAYVRVESAPAISSMPPVPTEVPPQATPELEWFELALTAAGAGPSATPLAWSLVSGPDGMTVSSSGLLRWIPAETQGPASHLVTVAVTDGGAPPLSATLSFSVEVFEVNLPPQFDPVGDRSIAEGALLEITLTASDPDLPPNDLTFSLESGPAGLTVSPDGLLRWTPTEAQGPGTHVVTVSVTDNGEPPLSASHSFTLDVLEVNRSPVLHPVADRSIPKEEPLEITLTASDPDLPPNDLNFSLESGPAGLTVSPDGLLRWTPTEAQEPGTHVVTVSVTDNGEPPLSDSLSFTLEVLEVNRSPVLHPVADRSIPEEEPLEITLTASDPDLPPNDLTFSLESGPAGLTVSPDGLLRWTPTEAQGPGTHVVTVSVTDNGEPPLSASHSFTLDVLEVNRSPVLHPVADRSIPEDELLEITLTASDPDLPPNDLTFSLESGPAGLTVSPTGLLRWTPTEAQGPGTHVVTVSVTDNGEPPLSASHSFTLDVLEVNRSPVLHPVADRSIPEDELLEITLTASDPDLPPNDLTFSLESGPGGLTVNPDGLLRWTPTEAQGPGSHVVTVSVTDNGEPPLSDSLSFTLNVLEANVPPQFDPVATPSVAEGDLLELTLTATVAGQPSGGLSYSLVNGPAGLTVAASGLMRWTPTEVQGPSAHSVTVAVSDNSEPPLSNTLTFEVVVSEVNEPPVFQPISDPHVLPLSPLAFQVTATDPDLPQNLLAYSLVAGPEGLSVSAAGLVTWIPSVGQGGASHPVTIQVTDNGQPPLADTVSFQIQVPFSRTVWLVGVDDATGAGNSEFSSQNNKNDLAPGLVTRLPNDPAYDAATNPTADDDHYLAGIYPAGFNRLTAPLSVPFDEPFKAWEGALTQGDRTNRLHFVLPPGQATPDGRLEIRFEFQSATQTVNGTSVGFGDHDIVVRMRNATGSETVLFSDRLSSRSNVVLTLNNPNAGISEGPNTLEFVRTGPIVSQSSITFDYISIESLPGNRHDPVFPILPALEVNEHELLSVDISATDVETPRALLIHTLLSGPAGVQVTPSGILTWTPSETHGGTTAAILVKATDDGLPARSATNEIVVHVRETNEAPVVPAVPALDVDQETPLNHQLTASDPDLPPNVLTWEKISGPTGLTISPTGRVQWSPDASEFPSTHVVEFRVTDNGLPPRSTSSQFLVVASETPAPGEPPVAGPVQTVNDVMRTSLPLSTHWKRSDIILSSRVYRRKPTYQMTYTVNGTSALLDLDTFGAADAFFANRMEWTYWYRAFDNQMLTEAQQRGMTISLTVNPNLPDLASQEPHNATYNIGRIKNINNAPAGRADYLLSGKYSGCARRTDFRSIWIDHVRSLISKNPAVVQSIQMDDVDMNIGFLSNGGCYCDVCNTGFRTYLATNLTPAELTGAGVTSVNSFSYRDYLRNNGQDPIRMISVGSSVLKNAYIQFQTANTLEFYTVVHHAITNHFQRRIAFSANTRSSPKVIEDRHDIFLREFTTTDPGAIYDTFVTQAATDNKPMALTYDSSYLIPEYRRFAASCFAAGGHGLVPWDVYVIPEDYTVPSAGRFYGTQQDFSPIFGFVKAMSHYLDGYEDAGLFQTVRADLRYQAQPVFIENNPSASLFIRAKGGPQDPVVIHIIRKDPANTAPFTISLNPDAFFGTPIKKTLYTMRPYSATVHDTARSTKNFSTLAVDATTTAMADVRLTQIQIPSFDLWAILILEPAGGGLVQPTILTRREMIEAAQEVRIVNSGKGTIRYTLDGSDPGPTSTLYNGPFSIVGARTIKARAFLGSEATPTSTVTVRGVPFFDIAASPATKLWLRPEVDLKNLPHNSPVSSWTPTIGPLVRAPNTLLPTLIPNIPPVYRTNALRGAPGVYFDGTNCIAASGLMNNVGIPQAFTVVMTTYTDDPDFGLTGNG
ncbi:MAG: putative Ig domain-containing protein, partial [Verrucomicrobiae bacterium]|nr:putative Ig domain-containing protein [Verrucomicrobiae bacterium]